jgi:hypothetical protein
MHWLKKSKAQRKNPRFVVSAPVPVSLSAQISLAHVPPRRLSSELLSDIIPSEAPDLVWETPDSLSKPQQLECPREDHLFRDQQPMLDLFSGGGVDPAKIAELELMTEDLFAKMSRGNASQRQELSQLLSDYADLIETLKVQRC